ncbi:histidinol-phosphate aminotransferase [Sphingobium sp. AEW010]|nr:histidinol-phosphate aminotransferase [Sphingobium sp. AEW010]TWD16481.1 histidinol-phosphate aminotransferase [Sphingobium sp. AEW013]TWD19881.1 histidinol-phosphate aminotransferase [Sphingobium sp. AEW001]
MPSGDTTSLEERLSLAHSRRTFSKIIAGGITGAIIASQAGAKAFSPPTGMVRIDGNESPTGPLPEAVKAAADILSRMNRYEPSNERSLLVDTIAQTERLPADHVIPWPGSSDPLYRIIMAYTSHSRSLVCADPVFEAAPNLAMTINTKVMKVPLTPAYAHDVKAMYAADPGAGVYYLCNPNNPTGTLTSIADIEWLLDKIPADSILLLDEAYIHYAAEATGVKFVREGRNLIILRTFSKIFGMAGMRMGMTLGRPDLTKPILPFGTSSTNFLPMPAVVAATASLMQPAAIAARSRANATTRQDVFAQLDRRGLKYTPAAANHFLLDWGRPAQEMRAMMKTRGFLIGRSWPSHPNCSRVSIGSDEEMEAFIKAIDAMRSA